ncbi:MAG: tRNA (adenosine(37)-N6)-threonylcarbamoyltransferase complex ATPase subunit type 1 TsaE [bacterium]|nr:tRNA (adenosine(37)-N6)-threonylcarbamoyltransferase complex ATPase subunit type 1 TsaE [bacterium]
MKKNFRTGSSEETQELAKTLLSKILNTKVVLLSGPLGSGKTTFVKGIAKALGIEKPIKSPTYTYLNSYIIPKSLNSKLSPRARATSEPMATLDHFDLYRLPENISNPSQTTAEIGLEDALNNPSALVIIEWPERLPLHIPAIRLHFATEGNSHQINLCDV